MRPKHLYDRFNSDKVSVWNYGICAISWRSARNNITGAPHKGCAWPNPRFRARFKTWKRRSGFKLFDRLRRGVKINSAGKLFLEDAGRILQEVIEATARAQRVARGQSGTL